MDTSCDESGTNVKPQVVRNYDGRDIVLPGDPRKVLRASENPHPGRAGRARHRHDGRYDAARRRRQGRRRGDHGRGLLPGCASRDRARTDSRRVHGRRGGRPRRRPFRHRGVRRRLRVHARRFRARTHRRRDVLRVRSPNPDRGPQRPSRHVEGKDGQRDQARRANRRAPAGRLALTRDDRRPRGVRPSDQDHAARPRRPSFASSRATSTRRSSRSTNSCCATSPTRSRRRSRART